MYMHQLIVPYLTDPLEILAVDEYYNHLSPVSIKVKQELQILPKNFTKLWYEWSNDVVLMMTRSCTINLFEYWIYETLELYANHHTINTIARSVCDDLKSSKHFHVFLPILWYYIGNTESCVYIISFISDEYVKNVHSRINTIKNVMSLGRSLSKSIADAINNMVPLDEIFREAAIMGRIDVLEQIHTTGYVSDSWYDSVIEYTLPDISIEFLFRVGALKTERLIAKCYSATNIVTFGKSMYEWIRTYSGDKNLPRYHDDTQITIELMSRGYIYPRDIIHSFSINTIHTMSVKAGASITADDLSFMKQALKCPMAYPNRFGDI